MAAACQRAVADFPLSPEGTPHTNPLLKAFRDGCLFKLTKYKELLDPGITTEEEFNEKRIELLGI